MVINDLIIEPSRTRIDHQFTVESVVYADPIFENWKRIGRVLSERQLSQDEIIDLFKRIEQGQAATGTNRTLLGKGKDIAVNIASQVSNILGKIQDSAPVAAVDVAYDQATDAIANMIGGRDADKSKIMDAVKKYRLLVKAYPKTAGFAKAALVAIAGLATGGAGLPAIAGLTYALDSAIRGEKLSSVLGKGVGAAALTWAGQQIHTATSTPDPAATADPAAGGSSLFPDRGDFTGAMDPYWEEPVGAITGGSTGGMGGGTYTIQQGDQLGYIAQANGNTVKELMAANPQIDFSKALQPGQQLNLPPSGPVGVGSVWKDYPGGVYGDRLRESFSVASMPLAALIDHRRTRYHGRLNEHQGRPSGHDVILSSHGVMHVLEQATKLHNNLVEYLRKKDTYRPDMPKAPTDDDAGDAATRRKRKKSGGKLPGQLSTTPSAIKKREKRRQDREAGITPKPAPSPAPAITTPQKPGIIGRTLNWLDRTTKTFGRQLTNKVTAEKLKMNWHQFGKPFDSDQLARWLIDNQKISPEVVSQVYSELKLPMPSSSTTAALSSSTTAAVTGGTRGSADQSLNYGTRLSASGKRIPRGPAIQPPAASATGASADSEVSAADTGASAFGNMAKQLTMPASVQKPAVGTTTASSTGGSTTELPTGRVHRAKTTPSAVAPKTTAQATPASSADYSQRPQGYGAVTYKTPGSQPAGISPTWTGRQPAAAKPMPKTVTGGATPAEYAELDRRIKAAAAKQPVSEQLTWSRNWDPSRLLVKQLRT